ELIADLRGAIRIVVDREDVYPSPEEKSAYRLVVEDARQGKTTQAAVDEAELKMKNQALMRKAREISALLQSMRADGNKNAIPVTVELRIGETKRVQALEGMYLIDMACENAIKAMDGVVSVA